MSQDARYDEEQSTMYRAQVLNLSYYDTSDSAPKTTYDNILTPNEIRTYRVVPISADSSHIVFGILTTTSSQTMQGLIKRYPDQIIKFSIISESGFKEYLDVYDPPVKVEYKDIDINQATNSNLINEISAILDKVSANDMLAYLVLQAHKLNASDIHVETKKNNVLIRFRIDGVLHPIANLNYDKYRILVSAIASAANISTSSKEAQQGHISQHVTMEDGSEVDVNVRLETIQTVNAMDMVMRLFNMNKSMYNLDRLGLSESERANVDQIISKPSGLVMIVGPTGSGKTTTLYSMISALANDQRKIITIEDPVEYQFDDITQISVTADLSSETQIGYADNIKAILRLDPDIVMVGEVRDGETAKLALQAALTGHLVLTTFHASNAAAALTRLYEIIGQNPLFISSIRLVMAQRLVRELDQETKEAYELSEFEKNKINDVIANLPDTISKPDINSSTFYKAKPTAQNPFGYNGQLAIREQFIMTESITKLLNDSSHTPTTQEIEAAAQKDGMRTMIQDAVLKVIEGHTTLEEIYRVIG